LGASAAFSAAALQVKCPIPAGTGPYPYAEACWNAGACPNFRSVDCWTGPTWETGITWARGQIAPNGAGRKIRAYAFGNLAAAAGGGSYSANVLGFTGSGTSGSFTCAISDFTADGVYQEKTDAACNNTNFVTVEGWIN
jgi:hypothetical protein